MSTEIKTILFVENDLVALQMYGNRLEREGFHLDTAQDGLEALKILSQLTPDLVVLDMILPKLGGGDVLKFIRADPRLKALPVIIFSNAPRSELSQSLELAGPTRHLLKSDCTFPMLLQSIADLLIAASASRSVAVQTLKSVSIPMHAGNCQPEAKPALPNGAPKGCAEFLSEALAEIPRIREHCFAYIKAPASPASLQHLPNLYQHVHFLSTNAGNAGCARVAMLTNAFDTLLSEIMVKPSWVTPSVLQTIAQAVDCLGFLLRSSEADLAQPMPQVKVLAVDDDAVCNHVMVTTLRRAKFDAKCVDDPLVALQLLETNHYDLVLLDINMPELTGFELCEKLRRFPHCKTTPVIFITGHNNFDNRKQSVLSGGHDFITKPVSPSELALKATIHLLKTRVQRVPAGQPGMAPDMAPLSKDAPQQLAPTQTDQPPNDKPREVAPSTVLPPTTKSAGSDAPGGLSPSVRLPAMEPTLFVASVTQAAALNPTTPPGNGAQTLEPSALLPTTTESGNSDAPITPSPEVELPPTDPTPASVSHETNQPEDAIRINQLEISEPRNAVPSATEAQTSTESADSNAAITPSPAAELPPTDPTRLSLSQETLQTAAPTQLHQREITNAQNGVPSNEVLPVMESGRSDVQSVPAADASQPSSEPPLAPLPEDEPVAAASVATNQLNANAANGVPAESLLPAMDSCNKDPENGSPPALPGSEFRPASVSEELPPPAGSLENHQRGSNQPSTIPSFGVATSPTETGTSSISESNPQPVILPQSIITPRSIGEDEGSGYTRGDGSIKNDPNETFDKITCVVAQIMFGDDNLTEMNLRLVRAALERYDVRAILNGPAAETEDITHNSLTLDG
jgi:CheY-like chemotaxis protein